VSIGIGSLLPGREMGKLAGRLVISTVLLFWLFLPSHAAKRKLTEIPVNGPFQLALDSRDNLYVVEHYGHRILRIDNTMSSVTVVAGNGKECCFKEGAPARSSSVYSVESIAVDTKGNIYFGGLNARDGAFIRKVDGSTSTVSTVAGRPSPSTRITPEGVRLLQADVGDPKGIVITKSGSLIVSIDMSYLLAELAGGVAKRVAGRGQKGYSGDDGLASEATFDLPSFLTSDANGNLFVADYFNHRVRRIDAKTQVVTTVAGNGSTQSSGDNGPAIKAGVVYPFGIAVDSEGNLYVIENGAATIRRVESKTGVIHTIAGTGHQGFSGDGGQAINAEISPAAIALDSVGNLYFSDVGNNRIRKIDTHTGITSTVVGNGLPKRKVIIE
jgi:trimeric autotransporter adhesin